MIVTFVWQTVGITMVLLLLGLAAIPRDPIEAARVDGASPGQIFRHIIWPLLLPTVLVVTILNVAAGFTTFDLLWVMAGDYPGKRTLSLAVYMYYEVLLERRLGLWLGGRRGARRDGDRGQRGACRAAVARREKHPVGGTPWPSTSPTRSSSPA